MLVRQHSGLFHARMDGLSVSTIILGTQAGQVGSR